MNGPKYERKYYSASVLESFCSNTGKAKRNYAPDENKYLDTSDGEEVTNLENLKISGRDYIIEDTEHKLPQPPNEDINGNCC